MVSDVALLRGEIERVGTQVAFVHMSTEEKADRFFEEFGVGDVPRFADPDRRLYQALELKRGSLGALLGPRVWLGAARAFGRGFRQGATEGDASQLPGVFLVVDGEIVKAHRSKDPSEVPDYLALATWEGSR